MPLHLLASIALLLAQAQPPAVVSPSPVHPMDQVRLLDGEVIAELLVRDLDSVLREGQPTPSGVNDTIKRLNLCLRAGRRQEAASLVDHLGTLGIDQDLTRAVIEFLFNRREIDLVARLIERVPGSGREWASHVVGYWLTDARKPQEEIDRWLADRGWTDDRVGLHARSKTDGPLVAGIVADVRSKPCTPEGLDRLLGSAKEASAPVNLDWIPAWCPTPTATGARDLGGSASSVPAVAAVFFERALAMPFTRDDVVNETRVLSMVPNRPDAEWERRFRARTRLALADAYRASGDATRAQAVLAQLTGEDRSAVADSQFARTAGQVQLETGGRQVQQALRAAEPAQGDSRDYWMARARYFAARGERADAADAFERALNLARTEPPARQATRWVLRAYAEYLSSTGARGQAWQLLRRELEAGSTGEESWIFDDLGSLLQDEEALFAGSGWIWPVLERRADWESATRLIEQLVRAAPPEMRSAVVNRSLVLASKNDRQRTLPLARALLKAGEGSAAVPLFEREIAQPSAQPGMKVDLTRAKRVSLRRQFDAELHRDDWRAAEQTWAALLRIERSDLDAPLTLSSTAWAQVQLAEAAARKGDGADALRFWRAAANVDRSAGIHLLGGMPLARYRAQLTAFYEAMAQRDPGSWVPAAALENLRRYAER